MSIVIPALDEAERLPGLLRDLARLRVPNEVIVVDGGSRDDTREIADRLGARVVRAPAGRGVQLGVGAGAAVGDWLCFLHADVRLDLAALEALADVASGPGRAGSPAHVFRLRIDSDRRVYRWIERAVDLRTRRAGLPYGDQGLVVTRADYDAAGGYRPVPLMEDVELIRALGRRAPVRQLPAAVRVSPRRWERDGVARRTIRNALVLAAYLAGVSPARLARWYAAGGSRRRAAPPAGGGPSGDPAVRVLVFAKRPQPGRVKTRLSPPLSSLAAADIYEACLRDVLAQVLRGPRSAEIWYGDEPGARAYFAGAFPGVPSRAQPAGDLGHRLEAAFGHAFARGDDRVIVLGSDAPTLPDAVLDEADAALADADAVFGPATDGGYYLVGVRARAWPRAAVLFDGIPWSTRTVWRTTLKRAAAAGLRIAALRTWYDIDRPGDLRRARRDADANSHLGRLLGERTDLVGARDAV